MDGQPKTIVRNLLKKKSKRKKPDCKRAGQKAEFYKLLNVLFNLNFSTQYFFYVSYFILFLFLNFLFIITVVF